VVSVEKISTIEQKRKLRQKGKRSMEEKKNVKKSGLTEMEQVIAK
jgi:hypothetical protein